MHKASPRLELKKCLERVLQLGDFLSVERCIDFPRSDSPLQHRANLIFTINSQFHYPSYHLFSKREEKPRWLPGVAAVYLNTHIPPLILPSPLLFSLQLFSTSTHHSTHCSLATLR